MNTKVILYVLLDKYAAHEMVFLSQAINDGEMGPRECPKYINKVVAQSSGYLEFAKQLLMLLENDSPEMTERYYMFNKMGLVELIKMMTTPQPHRN